jgi:hypothetical protein
VGIAIAPTDSRFHAILLVSLMPKADTTVILFTSPLFITVPGVIIPSEKVGPFRWTAVIVGFIRVLIMMWPSGPMCLLGIAVAMAAAFMQATLSIVLRDLGGHESAETISFLRFHHRHIFDSTRNAFRRCPAYSGRNSFVYWRWTERRGGAMIVFDSFP